MMAHVVIRDKVMDYDSWKPQLDEHGGTRAAAGCQGGHLLRSVDDPNGVVIFFKWDDMDKARKFTGSPDLQEVMQRAGVVDRPDIYFLDAVDNFAQWHHIRTRG